jgi:hypothetical protein
MSDFWKGLLITAIPIVVLSVTSSAGVLVGVEGSLSGFLGILWAVAALMLVIAIVVAIVFTVKGRRQIASGIWAGIGIGIASLGMSCFANMQNW